VTAGDQGPVLTDPPPAPTLEVADLSVSYRRGARLSRVVSDVSFAIPPGSAYGLVGESGCGKTTVAMSLMRYLPDNAVVGAGSRISFAGADLLSAGDKTLRAWRGNRIAMVYQDPGSALNPSMHVAAQVAEIYQTHAGMSRSDAMAAAEQMLAKVRIDDPTAVMRRYPHQLSGGQQQRVMIAMALGTNPDLLILDEPTTGLDATVEAEVLDLVEALRAEFATAVLFISHNLAVVARICDQVGVLYAGRLIEQGPAAQMFRAPRHPYTLGLLRSAPRRGRTKATGPLDSIPGSLPPLGSDPPGCPYAARCPIAVPRCHTELPELVPVGPHRLSRCIRHDEIDRIAPAPSTPSSPVAGEPEVLLRISNLTKRYRSGGYEVVAVSDVSFEVNRGEVFGLVGESGSGKSTLARCVVGMIDPSEGELRFEDAPVSVRDRRRSRGLRKKIQMVFQNPDTALNPRHSVGHILRRAVALLDGTVHGGARDERVAELAASVRLEPGHLLMRPGALSGGLKQRVAIARAFAGAPALVLCDEPVSALDVSVQAAILNLLVVLQAARGVSYIFISHDMSVVRYLADRVGVMYLGQLVEIGTTDAVFAPPYHPYTEALLAAAPSLDQAVGRDRIRPRGNSSSQPAPPSGCRFHPRCPRQLGHICRTEEPPWQLTDAGNRYRCHIAPAELADLQRASAEVVAAPKSAR